MQASQTAYEPPDLKLRGHYPYYRWMRSEEVPIHFAEAGVSDITTLPRGPWARTGKGLAAFIELTGTFQGEKGMFVCEIPPGESLDVQHHLYEQFTLIIQGTGATEIWQKDGPKRTFEWGKGSVFAPPKNTYYRMNNLGQEPVLYFGVTTAPRVFNGLFPGGSGDGGSIPIPDSEFELVFTCDHAFRSIYDGGENFFARTEDRKPENGYRGNLWYTNFIPNVYEETVDSRNHKVAGGRVTGYRMAGGFPIGHLGEWPVGRYHKAHFHGPGAVLVGLKGQGYVNLWPRHLGVRPWQDGHADQVVLVEWGVNSIYVPPDGYFHQHMSTGQVPARHIAIYGGGNSPLISGGGGYYSDMLISTPVREGGVLLDYEDEDPEVLRYFIEANRQQGVECTMPPVTYRTDRVHLAF